MRLRLCLGEVVERMRTHCRFVLAVAAAGTALAFPVAGQAALLGDLLPGLLSPAGGNPTCDPNAYQAFKRFSDYDYYVLMPGGAFEGTNTWTLKGGAKVVRGKRDVLRPWRERHVLPLSALGGVRDHSSHVLRLRGLAPALLRT
jgi:hypothetical protein